MNLWRIINGKNLFYVEKTELTVEDKYKRTLQEIECLRDELGKISDGHCEVVMSKTS